MHAPDGWVTGTADADGATLQCYRTGDGPPIVLAHGFSDSGFRWLPLAENLASEYEVIAYDARGHGHSDAPTTGYDIEDRIADLRAVVNESELNEPVLVGHSMGAITVARTAARYPDFPRGVVLEDPMGLHDVPDDEPDERVERVREMLKDGADQTVEDIIDEHYSAFDPDQARRLATASLNTRPEVAELTRNGYPSPLGEVFSDITCRTLVLRRDVAVDHRVKDLNVADSFPDGRLVHIPDADHYVFQSEYDAAYAELQTFLRRL